MLGQLPHPCRRDPPAPGPAAAAPDTQSTVRTVIRDDEGSERRRMRGSVVTRFLEQADERVLHRVFRVASPGRERAPDDAANERSEPAHATPGACGVPP